ncbi:MAG: HRDC domain-containing protein [Meiothermus sp.]|jgi:superfamily II DNA helicase RecQ|uniref:HRDC domain-containing protein n=1 Tax=Meiothermus TaxID=65551 RepID=UPI00048154ED|nr:MULTISPECIES: HRDC domain-containing protein [Meiothermus]MDT7919561.1 HRDC domain-containing protein [Meiothermus sp.]
MQCQTFVLRLDNPKDLERLNAFLAQVMPIQVSSSLVPGNTPFWSVLVFYEGQPPTRPGPAKPAASQSDPAFEALRTWRSQKAKEEGVPPYVVATNAELQAMLELKPKTLEQLAQVRGFGKTKAAKYGPEILQYLDQARSGS